MKVSEPPLVRAEGLVKRYGDVVAVNGLGLQIARGECLGLLGPNGAGKTTTVEMLEGLTLPDAGTIELFGMKWGHGNDRAIRERLGVQLQETQLSDRLTVRETLQLFRSFYARGRDVDGVLAALSLEEKRNAWVSRLSGGQKQRLALGCALVGEPDLLFLDEPTTGLDPQARRHLWTLVQEFCARGGTACLTTHYMEEAEVLASRVAIVDHGQIIAEGSPTALIARLDAPELIEVTPDRPLDAALWTELPGVHAAKRQPGNSETSGDLSGWTLSVKSVTAVLPELIARLGALGVGFSALSTRKATLEDVFIHFTGRGLRDD